MIELEKTFIVKTVPELNSCESIEIHDIYLPAENIHPILRIRKSGDSMKITKKEVINCDRSEQKEYTIPLSDKEFSLFSNLKGKVITKTRYIFQVEKAVCHLDVFHDKLKGLVLADFEFKTQEDKITFIPPEFCLADVTQEELIAGGMLAGKSYQEIEPFLKKMGYVPLKLPNL